MKTIYIIRVEAGHDFHKVVSEQAFTDRHVGELWGSEKCQELREKAVAADPSFEYGYSFEYRCSAIDLDESESEYQ